jgi:hypothetical protein
MGWYWFDESSDDEDNSNNDASRENQRRKQVDSLASEIGDETKPKQDGTAHVVAVAVADQQPEYVQLQQIDDDNNHDAQQSEVELNEVPACLVLFSKGGELDKGSAALEGVPNGPEGRSAFLEGEPVESSTTLLLGEVDEFPGGSVLLPKTMKLPFRRSMCECGTVQT